MPLEAGTCTITNDGAVSGTGLAKAMADALMAASPPIDSEVNKSIEQWTNLLIEQWTNLLAVAIVDHLVSNAQLTVTVNPERNTPT